MPNILNTLYPPMIETFMPAFICDKTPFITFSYSPYNSEQEITRIHVSIVNQKTNKSVLKTYYTPKSGGQVLDHIWIFDKTNLNGATSFLIPNDILKDTFKENTFYKVQLRFDKTPNSVEPNNTDYLIQQRFHFSEWSSVCLVKAIEDIVISTTDYSKPVQPGIVPISAALIRNSDDGCPPTERLQKYEIQIIGQNNEIMDESGWVYTGDQQDENSIYWFADLTNASADDVYTVQITATTRNQYKLSKEYELKIANYDPVPFTPIWTYKSVVLNSSGNQQTEEEKKDEIYNKIVTEEDGEVTFTIEPEQDLPPGFLYVKRATSLDNFKKWELISCTKQKGKFTHTITDSTVGSLVKYWYACQYQLMSKELFTTTKYSKKGEKPIYVYPDFYDILLYRQGKQIAIRYNEQVTSYAPVVNRQIINTLGGKYPKFAENANMNYKKITISGLLTVEADFNRKFINDRDYALEMNDYDEYMNGKYEIRNDTIADGDLTYENVSQVNTFSTYKATHTNWENGAKKLPATAHDMFPKNNWWLEREFREQALTWLNDGEPKLLKSMTEGNLAVILTDVSLTPNNQVGRRTYNISMTAYEVGDGYSLDTLDALGIITIPNEYEEYKSSGNQEEQQQESMTTISTIGQFYSKQSKTNQTFGLVTRETNAQNEEEDTWDEDNIDEYPLAELIQNFYTGALKNYEISETSYELKDLKINFESEPQWYDTNLNWKNKDDIPEENNEYILGYKIGLKTKKNNDLEEIFVNQRGYYQIPSNISVTQIILYDCAKATFDFKLSYKRDFNEILIPSEVQLTQKIVGQINGKFFPEQTLEEEIKNKYEYYRLDKSGININEHHYLNDITGMSFDGTPYTVLGIQFSDDKVSTEFLVGQTGVYNLMIDDCSIKEIFFKGRRMFNKNPYNYTIIKRFIFDPSASSIKNWIENSDSVIPINYVFSDKNIYQNIGIIDTSFLKENQDPLEKNNIKNPVEGTIYGIKEKEWEEASLWIYQNGSFAPFDISPEGDVRIILNKPTYHLREWEFFLDESAIEHTDVPEDEIYWYKIYFGKTDQKVVIKNNNSNNENWDDHFPDQYIYKNGEELYVPTLDGYKTTEEIVEPKFNTVYGFQGENKNKKYKIYYIDGEWYDVDYDKDNPELILAKVPVYGMVNYKGDLIEIQYD